MFFINACRGAKKQRPVSLAAIPDTSDFVFCYATPSSYYAYTDSSGSLYIKELCSVIKDNAEKASLCDMMTKVNERVASTLQRSDNIQAPEITSRLRKHIKFL